MSFSNWLWERDYLYSAYLVNRDDPALAIQEGFYYFGGGAYDLPKATAAFSLATKLQPNILWGHYQLARIYFVEGKFDRALFEVNLELKENPANLRSLYERGLIEIAMGNLSAAEEDFNNFIAWAPKEWGGYNDGAFVLAKEGKYAESETLIKVAMVRVPDAGQVPWLWNSLGVAQLNELKYVEAKTSFEEAKVLADKLSLTDWRRAYSANDPAADARSLAAFQQAIRANINAATRGATLMGT